MAKNPKIVAEFLHGLGNKLQPLWEEEKKVRYCDKKKKKNSCLDLKKIVSRLF